MMIHITRTEAAWMMNELRDRAKAYKGAAGLDFPKKSGLDAAFFNLRSEQLTSIADKLEKAIKSGSKRIAIDG